LPSAAPAGIGTKLRQARLDRSLSIEETAWRTRIRPDLLRALEDEDFDTVGHQAFVRSHLRSYAIFLGIDAGEVVDEFSAAHGTAPSVIEELERRTRQERKPPRAKWLVAAIVSGAVLVAAAAVGWLGGQTERADPVTTPSSLDTIASSSSVPVPAAEARVRLRIEALADASVSVLADGHPLFEGTLNSGEVRTFNARGMIEILLADASVVRLTLNGETLGVPGEPGSVYRQRYGPNGPVDG
jgi:cytoskeleton protein RodZ